MPDTLTPTTTDPAVAPAVPAAPPPAPASSLTFGQKMAAAMAEPADQPIPDAGNQGQVQAPTLKDQLAELGFADVKDDADAAQRIVAAYRQQKDQFAVQLREAIEQVQAPPGEFQQALPPATTAATDGKWWSPPEFDPALAAPYRDGENWKPETPAEIRAKATAAEAYYNNWAKDLVHRPDKVLTPIIEKIAEQKFRELNNQVESQKSYQSTIEKIVADNPWVYDRDPVTGQPKVDPSTRSYALSADGQLINSHFTALLQSGLPADRAWHYANLEFQAAKGQRVTAQAQVPQVNAQQKEALLARANGGALPQRGASLPTPANNGHTQNPRLRIGQRLLSQMQRDGISAT